MAKLLCLTLFSSLAISMASARPHPSNIKQVSDNDLVDLKNLGVDVNLLNSILKRGNVEQINDDDLIDLKNLGVDVNILNSILKRGNVEQINDDDLIDLKNLNVVANVLNTVGRRDVVQYSDNDLVDAKDIKVFVNALNTVEKRGVKKHSFKCKDGSIAQYSDNELIDLKKLGIDLNILNKRKRENVYQYNDDDLIDAKDANVDVNLLNSFDKRANVDAAFDILRRANYDVDLLSVNKRAENDMYQYSDSTHTCYCAKKATCGTSTPASFKPIPTAKPATSSTTLSSTTPPVLAPKPTTTKSSSTWTTHHYHSSTSSARVYKPSSSSSHHHYTPTTSSKAPVRSPSTPSPSCPSGWKHAGEGDIIQENDDDLIDLKNLNLNINILNSNGDETSKTVPATSKPKCTGKSCCYKTEKNSVVQENDNDLVDAKNAHIGVNLLNGLL